MISVQIVGPYDNTPMWWRNFVNAQQERCEEMNHSPNLMQQIIQSLAEYDFLLPTLAKPANKCPTCKSIS